MNVVADNRDKTEPNVERYNVTTDEGVLAFGKSYYEVDGRPVGANGNFYDADHGNWSMKGWPNNDVNRHVATYLHFPACSSNARIELNATGAVRFKLIVTCMQDGMVLDERTFSITQAGRQWVDILPTTEFPQSAWYKFDLECLDTPEHVGEFFYWQFDKTEGTERIYTADYMSSPSVHLSSWRTTDPKAPEAGRYDWVYQEVMIPESSAVVGTYCMSLGVLHGYMGIQIDSEENYPIIFSMWDNGNTDTDKNLPEYLRSGALDNEEGVTIARFGGEGTGAQAKRRTGRNWIPGQWVRFICNARPEVVNVEIDDPDNEGQKKVITYTNTLCTAWYMAEGKDSDWQYLATIRQSGANNFFDGWYSFLEDYNWPSGQWTRKAYYRNGGLHSMVDGKWYDANHVEFGHTDGGNKYGDRQDYGQGVTEDFENCFFMQSGGYLESPIQNAKELPLRTNIMPVTQETLDRLSQRVDQAIQNEQKKALAEAYESSREQLSSTGFTVVANNSEATNENKTDAQGNTIVNRATSATDGDENTYWHTKWGAGSGKGAGQWPFYIDIKVSDGEMLKSIEQVLLYEGRDANYRASEVQILVSDELHTNTSDWTSVGTYPMENANRHVIDLTSPITGKRYIRLNFTKGYGQYLVLNEVYFRTGVGRDALAAQVQDLLDKENQFNGYSDEDLIPLKMAYNDGNWTDAQAVKEAMVSVAAQGTILKFGVPAALNSLSSFKSYQIHNIYGMGDVIVADEQVRQAECGTFDVTDTANNWLVLRSEKWSSYYLYNQSVHKFLALQEGVPALVDDPTPVSITVRTVSIEGSDRIAFTISLNVLEDNCYLCAGEALGMGANTENGAAWELRDNYGITPNVAEVNALLAELNKSGMPANLQDSYSIRQEGTEMFLTTTEIRDGGGWTYSVSSNPEYFRLIENLNGAGYLMQSVTTGKYVGRNGGWDVNNTQQVWQIASIEEPTLILRDANAGLGVDPNGGVFHNKTGNARATWVFEKYVLEEPEPEPEPAGPKYYVIQLASNENLYLSTNTFVEQNNRETYCVTHTDSQTPEEFFITLTDDGTYTIQSVEAKKYVGHQHDWDVTNTPDTWIIANIEGAETGIFKSGTSGLGVDADNGVYTNKGNVMWKIIEVEHVERTTYEIVYRLTNEKFGTVTTEPILVRGGDGYPEADLPYGVEVTYPEGHVTQNETIQLEYRLVDDYPFTYCVDEIDFENIPKFYKLNVNGKWLGSVEPAEESGEARTFDVWSTSTPDHIAFIGTPWGFAIFDCEMGGYLGIAEGGSDAKPAIVVPDIFDALQFVLENHNGNYAFHIAGTTNGYLNNLGGNKSHNLGYWYNNGASTDIASTFRITRNSFYTIGDLVRRIDWMKSGFINKSDVEDTLNDLLQIDSSEE